MKLTFTIEAWDDYLYWQQVDKKTLQRINELIRNILRTPFSGIGKPEPLRNELHGMWSRRIDNEHRLVYHVNNEMITIFTARYHYS